MNKEYDESFIGNSIMAKVDFLGLHKFSATLAILVHFVMIGFATYILLTARGAARQASYVFGALLIILVLSLIYRILLKVACYEKLVIDAENLTLFYQFKIGFKYITFRRVSYKLSKISSLMKNDKVNEFFRSTGTMGFDVMNLKKGNLTWTYNNIRYYALSDVDDQVIEEMVCRYRELVG